MAEWLEYGSMGLLALVLIALGAVGREWLGRWMDNQKAQLNHQAEADKQQAAIMAERVAAADKFLQDLIAQDREERTVQLVAWQELVAQDIKAKEALADALAGLCERSDKHEERAEERHKTMLLLFEQQSRELS